MMRLSVILLMLAPVLAIAEVPPLAFESLFHGSREMYSASVQNERYRLVLSAPKKINSRWQFDREERVESHVRASTYELNTSFSLNDVTLRLDRHFSSIAARPVFLCDGLDCGSSNVWANEVFEVKQLYGLDQYQAYRVWKIDSPKGISLVVIYISQRGNGRVYAQVEQVAFTNTSLNLQASPKTLLQTLNTQKFYVLADIDAEITAVARALASRPTLKAFVVGHNSGRGDLDVLMTSAQQMAERMVDKLISAGVRASQITAHGVGPLTPRQGYSATRVEIVLR